MKKNILIIGGGFGGIYAFKYLSKDLDKFNIKIFNKQNYFLFTPLLTEAATGSLSRELIITPIKMILKNKAELICGTVDLISLKNNFIKVSDKEYSYDYLIISPGSAPKKLSSNGKNLYTIKTLEDAINIRNSLIGLSCTSGDIVINIIGGGPTGVEIAAEIKMFTDELFANQNSKTSGLKINLINAGLRLLENHDKKISMLAEKRLVSLDINILNDTTVKEIKDNNIITNTGTLKTDFTVLSTGVSTNIVKTDDDEIYNNIGKIKTTEFLNLEKYKNVFVLGDILDGYPATAQAAVQQAKTAAKNIIKSEKGTTLKHFTYKHNGFLVSLGTRYGVGEVKGKVIAGAYVWYIWRTVYLTKFPIFWKKVLIAANWTVNLFTKRDTSKI